MYRSNDRYTVDVVEAAFHPGTIVKLLMSAWESGDRNADNGWHTAVVINAKEGMIPSRQEREVTVLCKGRVMTLLVWVPGDLNRTWIPL